MMTHSIRETVARSTLLMAAVGLAGTAAHADQNHVLTLDAFGDHLVAPHSASLDPSDALTVEYWLNFRNTSGHGRIALSAPSDCQWGFGPKATYGTPDIFFAACGTAQDVLVPAGFQLPRNTWIHMAATFDRAAGIARVYMNGTLIAQGSGSTAPMQQTAYPLLIGVQPGYADSQLYGSIDDFRVWRTARTQEQIQASRFQSIDHTNAAEFPGLVVSYTFEDGGADATGLNHGTLMGGAGITIDSTFRPTSARQWSEVDSGNGHWYEGRTKPLSWDGASAMAQAVGGHLSTMASAAEQAFAFGSLPNFGSSSVWIGLYQDSTSPQYQEPAGGWRWVNDEPVTWTGWCTQGPTCPDNNGGEDVAEWAPTFSGWNDISSDPGVRRPFVIEWSADCNGDGIVDFTQVRHGTVLDADGDNIPDCCVSGGPCEPCPADLTRDGSIDGDDLARMLAAWGSTDASNDVDDDGLVNGKDLGFILAGWGYCTD